MNCLEFRRQLNIDAHSTAQEFLRHLQHCPRCAQAHERAQAFEASLQRALAVDVPPQLADSILLAQATEQHRQRRSYLRRGGFFALAAAAVLAVGIGMYLRPTPLSTLAVDHVMAPTERFALALTGDVSSDAVQQAFAKRGVKLQQIPSGISYVQCCPVGRFTSVHMVMPGKNGPVTVFYVNNDRVASSSDFQRNGMHGRSIPMGDGTLVLVAQDASQFDHLESE
ncbi:MAG TPA: DUF3379 family protein, partial [Rudaea sp.]|nr:DUF3379 family protein [Rudaea sp.]